MSIPETDRISRLTATHTANRRKINFLSLKGSFIKTNDYAAKLDKQHQLFKRLILELIYRQTIRYCIFVSNWID
jgi:hypothetical protein